MRAESVSVTGLAVASSPLHGDERAGKETPALPEAGVVPLEIRTPVFDLKSPPSGMKGLEKKHPPGKAGVVPPWRIRTPVLTSSPLHGDERAGKETPAW